MAYLDLQSACRNFELTMLQGSLIFTGSERSDVIVGWILASITELRTTNVFWVTHFFFMSEQY